MRNQINEIHSLMGRIDNSFLVSENYDILMEQTKEECFKSTERWHKGNRDIFNKFCMIDPTTDQNGKDSVGKYVLAMLKWYSLGLINSKEDFRMVANDIEDFHQVFSMPENKTGEEDTERKFRPIKFMNGSDINYDITRFKSPQELHEYMNQLKSEKYGTDGDILRKGIKYVGDDYDEDGEIIKGNYDGWEIIRLDTKEASNILGKYTQWCTSRTKPERIRMGNDYMMVDTNEFNDYNSQGKLYVIKKFRDRGKNRKNIFQVFIDRTGTMAEFRNGANVVFPLDMMERCTSPKVCAKIKSIAQKQKDEFEKNLIGFKEKVKNGDISGLIYDLGNTHGMPSVMNGFYCTYDNEYFSVLDTGQETGIKAGEYSIPPHNKFVCIYCKKTNSLLKVNGEIYFTGAEVTPYNNIVLIGTSGWPGTVWHMVEVKGDVGERVIIAGNDTLNLYRTDREDELMTHLPPHGTTSLFRVNPITLIPFQGKESVDFDFEDPNTYGRCTDDTVIYYNSERMTFGELRNMWEKEPKVEENRKIRKRNIR